MKDRKLIQYRNATIELANTLLRKLDDLQDQIMHQASDLVEQAPMDVDRDSQRNHGGMQNPFKWGF